jgi:hypothetical protein
MNTPDTYFTQEEKDELFPYLAPLDPTIGIKNMEKISLQQLMDSNNTGVIPPHVRTDLIRDMANSSSTDSLHRLGVILVTMEDGEQYYLQEESNIGSDTKMTKIIDMNTPLPDISVLRNRMVDNAINAHKNEVKARNKTGGTPGDNKQRSFEVLQKLKSENKIPQHDLDDMFFTYVEKGIVPAIIELLLSKTIDVNMVDHDGYTPLMVASKHGHTAIVKLLLKNGAKINTENNGWTALDFASDYLITKKLSKDEILQSELFLILASSGGIPGSANNPTLISYPDKNTRAYRHMTTDPGIGGRKKKTRKNNKKPKKHNRKTKNKRKSRRKRTRLGRKK